MCKKLKTVMTACGSEKAISYHCGRHSFATLALSKGMPMLTNLELHRADTEVKDIVDGKYDWRIERYENRNGLSR